MIIWGYINNYQRKEAIIAGTKKGGLRAAATNKRLHGADFYARIGAKGGRSGFGPDYKGGFGGDRELARRAGAKGGRISRRGPAKPKTPISEKKNIEIKKRGNRT